MSIVHSWDGEESFLPSRGWRTGHVGPEGPKKVGCVGWRQLGKNSEGSSHGSGEPPTVLLEMSCLQA